MSLKIGPRELSEMRYKAHDPISIALVEQSNQVLEYELFRNELVVSTKNRG